MLHEIKSYFNKTNWFFADSVERVEQKWRAKQSKEQKRGMKQLRCFQKNLQHQSQIFQTTILLMSCWNRKRHGNDVASKYSLAERKSNMENKHVSYLITSWTEGCKNYQMWWVERWGSTFLFLYFCAFVQLCCFDT